MSAERAEVYRQRAREMEAKAELARTDELKRSYLILARDWHEMAERHLYANSPSIAPMGTLERLAHELDAEAKVMTALRTTL
jgi:type II secretory pathway component PulJ